MEIAVLRFEVGRHALSLALASHNPAGKRQTILKVELEKHHVQ